jgi:PAS domain S-box-containing protein
MEPDTSQTSPTTGASTEWDLFEGLLRGSPVGLAVLDRSLRFVRVSDALAGMNGIPAHHHVGRTPMDLLPELPQQLYLPSMRRALAGEAVIGVEVLGKMPGMPGERSWEQSFFPLHTADGSVRGVGLIVIDVTDRTQVEATLRDQEQTLRLILESAPSAMLVVGGDGSITDLNGEAERLFGYERSELVGRSIDVLVPQRFRGEHEGHRAAFRRDPRTRVMGHGRDDLAGMRKDGQEFPAEVGLGVAPGRGDLVTCVVTDLSERRRWEAEHAALLEAEREARERLSRLQYVMDASLAQLSFDDRLEELLRRVRDVVGAESASVLLLDEQGVGLVATASVGLEEEVAAGTVVPMGAGVAGQAAATRRSVHLSEAAFRQVHSEPLRSRRLESLVAAPLVVDDEVIGVLQVAAGQPGHFGEDDLELLPMVASRVALAVDRAVASDRERSIAETLQHSLLPDRLPDRDDIDLATRYRPGTAGLQVGGDWYDVVPVGEACVGLVIGDVMGHGVRAAAVMGQLRSVVRIYLELGTPLPDIAANLNRLVLDMGDSEITSLLVARLDSDTGQFDWVSAGHLPPVVRHRDGRAVFLGADPNPPLGSLPGASFACHELSLAAGATVLLYTDGLVERRDRSLDATLSQLAEVVATGSARPDALCDGVLDAMVTSATFDDVALLAVQLHASAVSPLTLVVEPDPEAESAARAAFAHWLLGAGASDGESGELLVAVSGARTATRDRTSGGDRGRHLVARLSGDHVEVVIADHGERFPPEGTDRGRGLVLMEALVDRLVISSDAGDNEVRLTRRLHRPTR